MEKYASLVDLVVLPELSSQGAARKSRHPTRPGQAKRMADASACCFDSDQNVRNTWCWHLRLAWNILDILAITPFPKRCQRIFFQIWPNIWSRHGFIGSLYDTWLCLKDTLCYPKIRRLIRCRSLPSFNLFHPPWIPVVRLPIWDC